MDEKELLENLLQKCYRYLLARSRSEKEILIYLTKKAKKNKKIDEKIINAVITNLKEQGLINDLEFVAWWVDNRSYFRPKGTFALRAELLRKGISKELIDEFFERNKLDELKLAKEVLNKKEKILQHLEPTVKFKKSINLLLGRGFSYQVAKKAFEEFNK